MAEVSSEDWVPVTVNSAWLTIHMHSADAYQSAGSSPSLSRPLDVQRDPIIV